MEVIAKVSLNFVKRDMPHKSHDEFKRLTNTTYTKYTLPIYNSHRVGVVSHKASDTCTVSLLLSALTVQI